MWTSAGIITSLSKIRPYYSPPNRLPNLFCYVSLKTPQGVPVSDCIYAWKHAKLCFVNVVWIRLATVMKMTSCWYKSFNGHNNSLVKPVILSSWKDVLNKKNMTFRSEGEKMKLFQKQCLLPFLLKTSTIVKDLRKEGYKERRLICDVSIMSFSSSVVLILLQDH